MTFPPSVAADGDYVQVCEGDYVSVMPEEPNDPLYIARVVSLWEESTGEKSFHASWFSRGGETVLGETSDPYEIFLVDSCSDTPLSAVKGRVSIQLKQSPSDWRMLGGQEEIDDEKMEEDGNKLFFQKWYDPNTARFEDPPIEYLESRERVCQSCIRNKHKVRMW